LKLLLILGISAKSYRLPLAKTALKPSAFLNVNHLFLKSVHKALINKSIFFEIIESDRSRYVIEGRAMNATAHRMASGLEREGRSKEAEGSPDEKIS
jgi:hypothetical protein